MPKSKKELSPKDASMELPDEAPYQMPLKMTQGDRRLLLERARAANTSPTRWIIGKIQEGGGPLIVLVRQNIAFMLDRRRQERADELAKSLGYAETADLAKDLLHRALDNPKAAEAFLFGPLESSTENKVLRSEDA